MKSLEAKMNAFLQHDENDAPETDVNVYSVEKQQPLPQLQLQSDPQNKLQD